MQEQEVCYSAFQRTLKIFFAFLNSTVCYETNFLLIIAKHLYMFDPYANDSTLKHYQFERWSKGPTNMYNNIGSIFLLILLFQRLKVYDVHYLYGAPFWLCMFLGKYVLLSR